LKRRQPVIVGVGGTLRIGSTSERALTLACAARMGSAFASRPRSWWISRMRIREGGARDAEPPPPPLSSNELAERWPGWRSPSGC
jgi:hypothetical protein